MKNIPHVLQVTTDADQNIQWGPLIYLLIIPQWAIILFRSLRLWRSVLLGSVLRLSVKSLNFRIAASIPGPPPSFSCSHTRL